MALNIKNPEVEALVVEVAELTGETRTEAVRRALLERRERLRMRGSSSMGPKQFRDYLEREVWPDLPPEVRQHRLTRDEEDGILGYGPEGV